MSKKKRIVRNHNKYCFNCRKQLDFRWFITDKVDGFTKNEKLKIWDNKKFQLFCCSCYANFRTGTLKVRNNKLKEIYSGSKREPEQKTLRDIIRNIDPIDYRTLERFTNE